MVIERTTSETRSFSERVSFNVLEICRNIRRSWVSYVFIAPFGIVYFIMVIAAVVWAIYLSFTYFNILQPPTWVGLSNYKTLFTDDPIFLIAIKKTLLFAIITGPIGYFASLIVAWLINQVQHRKFFTSAFYIPSILSGVTISVIWLYIFAGDRYGLLNHTLIRLGILDSPILWLKDVRFTMPSIMVVALWMSMGTSFLVFIAGLQNIPEELLEAGLIDGTNKITEFFYITLPTLRPQLLFGAVMSVVNSFQVFDLVQVMAGFPSVLYCAHTIVAHLWDYAFARFEMGYASATAVVLFLLTFGISRFFMWLLRER